MKRREDHRPRQDPKNKSTAAKTGQSDLVLDDFLGAVKKTRGLFALPRPMFGLNDMERYPGAKAAVKSIIREAVNRHSGQLYVRPGSLLEELGTGIYEESTTTETDPSRRIAPGSDELVLRKTLEVGTQTLVQLPSRYPQAEYSRNELMALESLGLGETCSKGQQQTQRKRAQ